MRRTAARASAQSGSLESVAACTSVRAQPRPAVAIAVPTRIGFPNMEGSFASSSSVFTSVISDTETPARASAAKYGAMGYR